MEARVISDRETGRSKGFAFVSMANARDAEEALKKMNGMELQGRQIRIDKSTPKGSGMSKNHDVITINFQSVQNLLPASMSRISNHHARARSITHKYNTE